MNTDSVILLSSSFLIAFFHTITGPDHYIPFGIIAKLKKWSLSKTIWFTFFAGLGHVMSSVILGVLGIVMGISLNKITLWEEMRGSIVSILFLAFGLVYFIYGILKIIKNKPHSHFHVHSDGTVHKHTHTHTGEHAHIHDEKKSKITPWIFFIIFIFGPCEPLIPLVMYPAASNNIWLLIWLTFVFAITTIFTMIALVLAIYMGLKLQLINKYNRFNHAIIGGTILLCGVGMVFLGL